MLIKISTSFDYIIALFSKRYPATTYEAMSLSILLAIIALLSNYEDPALAQITPAANPANGVNDAKVNEDVTPGTNDNVNAADPITPSGSPSSTLGDESDDTVSESSQALDQKYITTTDDAAASKEKTLLERIFSQVHEDLKASGITGMDP
jgi:hypothetical protein